MPCYSTAGVVNSASYATGWFAPNTFVSIFGRNLAYVTANGTPGSEDPTGLFGGVKVLVNTQGAFISYISPNQVDFVLTVGLTAGTFKVQLLNNSLAGPAVTITLHDTAPALFINLDGATAIAIHSDGTLVTLQKPAHPGESLKVFGTGLGPFVRQADFVVPVPPVPIERRAEFELDLDGVAVPLTPTNYVGAMALYVGVVEIDFQVPAGVGRNPEIRIRLADRLSPPSAFLPVD